METTVPKSWKPTTAGILCIISGALRAFSVIVLIIVITAVDTWRFLLALIPPEELPFVAPMVNAALIVLLVVSAIETIVPIIGGVYAIQRRKWGWALAGSIIAIVSGFPMGIASVMGVVSTIFVAMAKEEFE